MVDVVFDLLTPVRTVLDFVEEEVDGPVEIAGRSPEDVFAEPLDDGTNLDARQVEGPVTGAIESNVPRPFAQILVEKRGFPDPP